MSLSGFPNQFVGDSWVVGCGRADHADTHDGRGLGDCGRGFSRRALQAWRARPRRPEIPGGLALLHRAQHHVAHAASRVRQLEQRVEALLAAEPDGHLRGVLRGAGGDEQKRASGADVRLHDRAGACVRGGRKRGQETQALGRSRGGFSTKIHLKTDHDGHPIAFHLTGGEASDSRNFETLLDIGPDITPRAAVADKGYDAKANREAARERGICPVIPYRDKAKDRPKCFAKALYRGRARIEQTVGKLKRFKRVALRCEKTAQNYASFVALACGFTLIKSVHRT